MPFGSSPAREPAAASASRARITLHTDGDSESTWSTWTSLDDGGDSGPPLSDGGDGGPPLPEGGSARHAIVPFVYSAATSRTSATSALESLAKSQPSFLASARA